MSGRVGGFLGRLFGRSASRGRTKVVTSRNDLRGGRAEQELAEAMGELGNIAKQLGGGDKGGCRGILASRGGGLVG